MRIRGQFPPRPRSGLLSGSPPGRGCSHAPTSYGQERTLTRDISMTWVSFLFCPFFPFFPLVLHSQNTTEVAALQSVPELAGATREGTLSPSHKWDVVDYLPQIHSVLDYGPCVGSQRVSSFCSRPCLCQAAFTGTRPGLKARLSFGVFQKSFSEAKPVTFFPT